MGRRNINPQTLFQKRKRQKMKYYSTFTHPKNWRFIIEHDKITGFYLFIYEDYLEGFNFDLGSGQFCERHQQDHLQDTFEIAKQQALEDFGVPLDSWQEAPSADNKIEGK